MARTKNLQPWLDYFHMLRRYEHEGFLLMEAEKHEAYITRAALCTLSAEGPVAVSDGTDWTLAARRLMKNIPKVVRRIRSYAAWLSREGKDYLARPFALHVVHEDDQHDLLYTVIITSRRRWWKLWMWHDSYDVIRYDRPESERPAD